MEDARQFVEAQVVIALAGHIAQRRSKRGSGPGWVRHRSRDEEVSYHEAAHAVTCRVAGEFVYALSIVPDPNIKITGHPGGSGGFCHHGRVANPSPIPKEREVLSDFSYAAGLCSLLTDGPRSWKAVLKTVRRLQAVARALIEANWLLIDKLAQELRKKKNMNREEIEAILKPGATREPAIAQFYGGAIREQTIAAFDRLATSGQVVQ